MSGIITERTADLIAEQIKGLSFDAAWDILSGHAEQAPMADDWEGPFILDGFYITTDRNTIVFTDGSVLTCYEGAPFTDEPVQVKTYSTLLHAQHAGIIEVEEQKEVEARQVHEILSQLHEDEVALLRNHFQNEASND